jgi:hypothetical protein
MLVVKVYLFCACQHLKKKAVVVGISQVSREDIINNLPPEPRDHRQTGHVNVFVSQMSLAAKVCGLGGRVVLFYLLSSYILVLQSLSW